MFSMMRLTKNVRLSCIQDRMMGCLTGIVMQDITQFIYNFANDSSENLLVSMQLFIICSFITKK